jgi:hypothetical protein
MLPIDLGKLFGREREFRDLYFRRVHILLKRKESVFLRIKKGKHFPRIKPFVFL